jgi:putative ABC transport system substrate-binding protein
MEAFWLGSFFKCALRNLKSAMMVGAVLFALCSPALAQQPKKVYRIGFLGAASVSANSARIEALRQGLRELGYVEGKNIVIELRYADGKLDNLPALAAELVRLKVDIIVSAGPVNTRALKEATTTIPIVMAFDNVLSPPALSPVWRGQAGILSDYQPLPQR